MNSILVSKHSEFIKTPLFNILSEFVSANKGIGDGIETFALSEYTFQSVFLRMTGAQEQKMKCICWELATNDYNYRYNRYGKNPLGECSNFKEKNTVYKDLLNAIIKMEADFDIVAEIGHTAFAQKILQDIRTLLNGSNLATWAEPTYNSFIRNTQLFPANQFARKVLFESVLQDHYELLYIHRNRCAHNLLSYQENLPSFKELFDMDHKHDNYFVRFAILILIDEIFIKLFKKYTELIALT